MALLDLDEQKRLNDTLSRLVNLQTELRKLNNRFDEGHITWLQRDIQSLHILAEKMELKFY